MEVYINMSSIKETHKIFGSKFPGKGLPAKRAIQALVKKWHTMGSMAIAPKQRPPSVHMPEVTDDICRRIMQSPKKSIRKLSQQDNVPTCVKESRSQAISCNGCATVKRGRCCETCKLLQVASE